MANDTMRKFGFPETLVRDYLHWVVLARPAQVTLGSLVLCAKSEAESFGALERRGIRRTGRNHFGDRTGAEAFLRLRTDQLSDADDG